MNVIVRLILRIGQCAALSVAALLAGCGGDETGVGSGGTGGFASANVSGFGSIYLDGERWDDRNARVEMEVSPAAAPMLAPAQLGQRVDVEYTTFGIANLVRIEAEVIGPVAELPSAMQPNQFKAAGQTVRVNMDANAGPVTVLAGYTALSQMALNDIVEVHGAQRYDSTLGRYIIQASRVEKRATLPGNLIRVAGVVENYNPNPALRSFKLGELTVNVGSGTLIVPANRQLANGQRVVVWGSALAAGPALSAGSIRIRTNSSTNNGANNGPSEARIAGVISKFDAANAAFDVNGLRVLARNALIVPANQALANDLYVIVTGQFQNDGSVAARKVQIRKKMNQDIEVELKGTVTDYVNRNDFKVRGVSVDAGGLAMFQSCPGNTIANGSYVEVEGAVSGAKVIAEKLKCSNAPGGAVIDVRGVASAVNTTLGTFTLTPAAGTARTVQWTPLTYFDDVTPATLNGKTVEVEGHDDGALLVAREIELK